jgi:hypothetical protein
MPLYEVLLSLAVGIVALVIGSMISGVPVLSIVLGLAISVGVLALAVRGFSLLRDYLTKKQERALDARYPGWMTAREKLEKALRHATYRWQLQEFGVASKEFVVKIDTRKGDLGFHSFRADNDALTEAFKSDLGDDLSEEGFAELQARKDVALDRMKPSGEQARNLERALTAAVDRQENPKLSRILLRDGRVAIDTRSHLPYGA